jgi:hypothetical protein
MGRKKEERTKLYAMEVANLWRLAFPNDKRRPEQGITQRCRLSWLTNSALVYEPKCGGGGEGAGAQPMSTDVHMEPK